jgi:ribose 5-phosphate isomerase B
VETAPDPRRARIAFGTDASTVVTGHVVGWLRERGHEVVVLADPADWPDVGRRVGEAVASGVGDLGVVCCWTGTGVSIAANKVSGVRAALCTDAETARGARRWNDANVLALGLRLTTAPLAEEMLAAFLETSVDDGEQATISRVEAHDPPEGRPAAHVS